MKKKIDLFWYWFIFVVAFVLCFFAINNKKVNAYYLNENGNVVSDNLFDISNTTSYQINVKTEVTDNETIYFYSSVNNGISRINYLINVEVGETYTFSVEDFDFSRTNSTYLYIASYPQPDTSDYGYLNKSHYPNRKSVTFTAITNTLYIKAYVSYSNAGEFLEIKKPMLNKGDIALSYEPFGTWYNENFVGDLATGVISYSNASLTYDNRDYGTSHLIADVSSYIDSSFGYLYFERLWAYLDTLTSSEYENAWLTLQLNNKMNLNTTYILNAMFNNGNYGVGAKFYQGNKLVLDVTNWINNNYSYCNETSGAVCSVELSKFVNVGDFPNEQNSFTYFDKIVVWSGDADKRTGSFGFQNISYNQGYNSGYNIGYSTGNSNGEKTGYDKGYNNGYLYGYEKGVDAVDGTDNTLVGLVGGILTAPVNMLKTIFDFEFLGINLTHFIFSIVSLFIVIWLIKIFL